MRDMPRFAANLTMMYPEHAFLDRFAAAARDGFRGVEFLFPYEHPAPELRKRLDGNGLELARTRTATSRTMARSTRCAATTTG